MSIPVQRQARIQCVDPIRYSAGMVVTGSSSMPTEVDPKQHRVLVSGRPAAAIGKVTAGAVSPAGQLLIDRLSAIVISHLDDPDFTVEVLAARAGMSRIQLHRKLKAISNTTATCFIRAIRLARAAELLAGGNESVTQVAYAVGFGHLSYFARLFQERYGMLPSQYGRAALAEGKAAV